MDKRNIAILVGIPVLVLAILGGYFFFSRQEEESIRTDAMIFKEEYESLNGKKESDGHEYRILDIPSDNRMVYQTADEIVKRIENKETFAVYFGFAACPWCRSVLPSLLEVVNDLGLSKIYYVDIENIRDEKELQDGKVVTTKEGSEGYQKLLTLFDEVLDNYTLKDENQKEVDTKEKRIYAPNVLGIVDGKVETLTTGISKKQEDAYIELTGEMKSDAYNQFKCALECIQENETVCTKKEAC